MIVRLTAPFFNRPLAFRYKFLGIALLFLAIRLTYLCFSVESTSWNEELYRGSIAHDMIHGPTIPFWDYPADGYDGGSLVIGLLAVPFIKLIGASLFSLKLVPLILNFMALLFTVLGMRNACGDKAALSAGLLWSLAPPVWIKLSLVAIGSHPEAPFWISLVFFLMIRTLESPSAIYLSLTGFILGLSYFYSPGNLILIAAALAVLLSALRRRIRCIVFLMITFLIGLTPYLIYNLKHRWTGIEFLFHSLNPSPSFQTLNQAVIKAGVILLRMIPHSLERTGTPTLYSTFASFLYMMGLTIGLLLLLRTKIQREEVVLTRFLILHLVFFLAAYGLSQFRVFTQHAHYFFAYTYLTPFFFSFLILAALGLSKYRAARWIIAGMTVISIGLHTSTFQQERFLNAAQCRGFNDIEFGSAISRSLPPGNQGLTQGILKIQNFPDNRLGSLYLGFFSDRAARGDVKWQDHAWIGLCSLSAQAKAFWFYALGSSPIASPETSPKLAAQILSEDNSFPDYFYQGKSDSSPFSPIHTDVVKLLSMKPWWPGNYEKFFWEGVGIGLTIPKPSKNQPLHDWSKILQSLSEEQIDALSRGIGRGMAGNWASSLELQSLPHPPATLFQINPRAMCEGIGWELMRYFSGDSRRTESWIEQLHGNCRDEANTGLQKAVTWFKGDVK